MVLNEKLNQLDKAIEHYKGVLAQYPENKEGWQASARAAELLDQIHKEKEAFDLLNQAFNRVSSAQGKAWILATQARLFAKNKMLDEAAKNISAYWFAMEIRMRPRTPWCSLPS